MTNLYLLLHQKPLKFFLNWVRDGTTGSTGRWRFGAINLELEFNLEVYSHMVWLILQHQNMYSHMLTLERL